MARLEFAVEIAAPPNLVSAFFVPQRMPYWYGTEMQSRFEFERGAADFQAGQKVRITGRMGLREVALTAVVTRYERGRVLEWRFQDAYGVRGLQRWEIEPAPVPPGALPAPAPMKSGPAGTRVRMRDEYEFPGRLGRFLDRLVTHYGVAQRDRRDLARLKKLAERGGS